MSIKERAEKEWLANAVWLVANGLKGIYADYCKTHDLQDDSPVSLQLFKNHYIQLVDEVGRGIIERFGLEDEDD